MASAKPDIDIGAYIFKHKKLENDDLLFAGNHTSSCTLQEINLQKNFVIIDALGVMA